MGYLPHPGYKGVPQSLNILIGPQSKPLREPNLAPKLEGMFLQLRPQLQETLLWPKKADVAESVAALKLSGGEWIKIRADLGLIKVRQVKRIIFRLNFTK